MSTMPTNPSTGWYGPSGTGHRITHGAPGPLESPQYGPAWVADHYGTTHEQRLARCVRARVAVPDVNDRDAVAVAFAGIDR